MIRIGIDVGGTNTDAVMLDGKTVLAAVKTATTSDASDGIRQLLTQLIAAAPKQASDVGAVMIGTTHFINAVAQRRHLNRAAALRICLPSSASLRPMIDWPEDLASKADGGAYLVEGGHEFNGRPLMPLDEAAVAAAARQMRAEGIDAVAVTAVFSPLTAAAEVRAAEILQQEHPDLRITLSSRLGRIGLLERENVALLNACLANLAERTVDTFETALNESEIAAPLYITQNDGTVASVEAARGSPVYSFASGPTNSMRGAAFLSKLDSAMALDIGGTTSDIGCLVKGFPREANSVVEVGGVRTLFRMPDVLSLAIGGGTIVSSDGERVGPDSVGHRLREQARVFGGEVFTLSDIAVAAGIADIGDRRRVEALPKHLIDRVLATVHDRLASAVDRMKPDAAPTPLLAVGGGAMLAPAIMDGVSEIVAVPHAGVANAVGAAIAQVSGEVDAVFKDLDRAELLEKAETIARSRAIEAGADPSSLQVVDREDLPLAYLPGNAVRARVRVVGDLAGV